MDDDRFALFVVEVHYLNEFCDLPFLRNPVVRNVDVIVGKLIRNILPIVELTATA